MINNHQERLNQILKKVNKNKKSPSLRYRWYKFREWTRKKKDWKELIVYSVAIAEVLDFLLNLYKIIIQ